MSFNTSYTLKKLHEKKSNKSDIFFECDTTPLRKNKKPVTEVKNLSNTAGKFQLKESHFSDVLFK